MIADSRGEEYRAFRSLAEARATVDAAVVMQGDDGGSIYLTCPARLVGCDEGALNRLLHDFDEHLWNDADTARLFYERAPLGTDIPGGTGGGIVIEGVWLHEKLEARGLRAAFEAVIAGRQQGIAQGDADG